MRGCTAVLSISIHAAREGGDRLNQRDVSPLRISIHAAREGGDVRLTNYYICSGISIHAAREGGDVLPKGSEAVLMPFQSTPPVKAATITLKALTCSGVISIHAAREGGDHGIHAPPRTPLYFNPRRP